MKYMNIDSWVYDDNFNRYDDYGNPILKCLRFIERTEKDRIITESINKYD